MTTTGKRIRKSGSAATAQPVVPSAPAIAPAILMPEADASDTQAAIAELIATAAHHPQPVMEPAHDSQPLAEPAHHPEPVVEPAGPAAAMPAPSAAVPAVSETEDVPMDMNTAAATATAAATQVQDQATRLFTDAQARTEDTMAKGARALEDMTGFAKGNVEALVESSRLAARGFETLGQNAADYARKSFETMTAATKTLAQAKSPTEFFQLQQDLVRQSLDALVAETSRSTETMMKLAGEVAQPISNRMAIAADRLKVAA